MSCLVEPKPGDSAAEGPGSSLGWFLGYILYSTYQTLRSHIIFKLVANTAHIAVTNTTIIKACKAQLLSVWQTHHSKTKWPKTWPANFAKHNSHTAVKQWQTHSSQTCNHSLAVVPAMRQCFHLSTVTPVLLSASEGNSDCVTQNPALIQVVWPTMQTCHSSWREFDKVVGTIAQEEGEGGGGSWETFEIFSVLCVMSAKSNINQ
jgi:hypothetical protein